MRRSVEVGYRTRWSACDNQRVGQTVRRSVEVGYRTSWSACDN